MFPPGREIILVWGMCLNRDVCVLTLSIFIWFKCFSNENHLCIHVIKEAYQCVHSKNKFQIE